MAKPLIKICGVRNLDIAEQSILHGAHYIGLIFHPASKRAVDLPRAKIISALVKKNGATPVAVFVEDDAKAMEDICQATNIQTVQLHGNIARQQHHLLSNLYQRIYVRPVLANGQIVINHDTGLSHCDPLRDLILFDSTQPGSGLAFNWETFDYAGPFQFGLAGGLNADNVERAIKKINPTFVDVSSGVENSIGEKDFTLIHQFINKATMDP